MLSQINKRIATRANAARLAAGLSLHDFAKKLGCSSKYLMHLETGLAPISAAMLVQIADALDLTVEHFVTDTASETAPEVAMIDRGIVTLKQLAQQGRLHSAIEALDAELQHETAA